MKLATTQYGKFLYWPPDAIGQALARGEFFDEHLRPYMDWLHGGDVLVDVGANIGWFTIYAALIRNARVEAFEASREVFNVLKQNIELNGVGHKVLSYNAALWSSEARLKIYPEWYEGTAKKPDGEIDYDNCANSGGMCLVLAGQDDARTIKGWTLDSFHLERVMLLKVDAQQSDLRVLVGARETIARCRPTILFEFETTPGQDHNANGDTLESTVQFLEHNLYNVKELKQHQGGSVDFVATPRS